MAVKKTCHIALTLRGNEVKDGIRVEDNLVPFKPTFGLNRQSSGLMAVTKEAQLKYVHVATTCNGVVLVSCTEEPQKELVLVQQYETGSGAKRWPGFHVEFGDEVRQLSQASTSGGSGHETWTLVSAPIGWAKNISNQFQNFRDLRSQTISYSEEENETDNAMAEALRRVGLI